MNLKSFLLARAKRKFNKDPELRLRVYDKIKSLLSNSMTSNQVINKLLARKKPSELYMKADAAFLSHVSESYRKGMSLADSLRGWASPGEIMLIRSGEETGRLNEALVKTIEMLTKMIKMKKEVKSQITYPIALFVALFVIVIGFAKFMLPILTQFGDPEDWDIVAQALYYFSTWMSDYWIMVLIVIYGLIQLITYSMPRLRGSLRETLDKLPPYSIYRAIQSGLLLISIGSLMKSGVQFRKSLESIRQEATPYLDDKIKEVIINIDKGMDNGKSINTDFVGDIGDDIEDYASGANIEEAMEKLGDIAIQDTIEKITKQCGIARILSLLLVASFILWIYGSFVLITLALNI
jgi:type II secretory pathway component PulF